MSRAPLTRRRAWLLVAAVAALVVVAFAVTRVTGEDPVASPSLEHVHGLGVDPADGALYAGSHGGLFRVGDTGGILEGPVADRVQDFMGFAVAGPGRFLASGHPGEGQDGPHSLGLLESTDAGQTWVSRSLAGQADFHALEYRHGVVYGADSMTGGFMVSTDLEQWETRSTLPLADFAVSPTDADLVVATTQEGPVVSSDGGRTFELIEGAPLLQFLSWAEDGTLVGIAPDGAVHASREGTSAFTRVGDLGASPEALYAEDGTTVYAAASGRLRVSSDGGKSFVPHPQ